MHDNPSQSDLPKKQCVNNSTSEYSLWLSWVCSYREEKDLEKENQVNPKRNSKEDPNILNYM